MYVQRSIATLFIIFIISLFTPITNAQGTNPSDPQCVQYSQIANLSTIGINSTYRSAFLQASPKGTMGNQFMFNDAVAKIPALQNNVDLNNLCGNLTALAITQAEFNFTQGIVAQFSGLKGNPQAISSGLVVPGCVIAILLTTFVVHFFAP